METSSTTIREPGLKHSEVDSLNEIGLANRASIEVLLRFRDKLDYFIKPAPKDEGKDSSRSADMHTNLQILCSQTLDINNLIQQCENRFGNYYMETQSKSLLGVNPLSFLSPGVNLL